MASNFLKLVFLFILGSFFNFQTTKAQDLYRFCSSENITTANRTYQVNLMTLFSSLSSNATVNTFYNETVGGNDTSNAVYGLFMCRGDVSSNNLCGQCVLNATQKLSSECYLSPWAIIWYDECMVRYSNRSFFSIVETSPAAFMWNNANVSNSASFMHLLADTMNRTADEAASSIGDGYATKEANVSKFQTLYCLAQCTQDLSPQACKTCLVDAIAQIPFCCEGKKGGRVLFPSCNVRYELYPFHSIKATQTQDAGYLSHNCSTDKTNDKAFQQNLGTLFTYLSSNASSNSGLYMIDVDRTVFGLFMCRADIPPPLCGQRVSNATNLIASECSSSVEAIVWYDHCLLRYSNQSFFHKMSKSPSYDMLISVTSVSHESSYKFQLSDALNEGFREIGKSDERYWTKSSVLDDNQTLYILAQCTRDLSSSDCSDCLYDMIGLAWPRLASVGGRVLYPSCTMRFELFQFYGDSIQYHTPPPPPSPPALAPHDATDAHLGKLLSWSERHKIIEGVAREILYLHEYSRLKVIYRNLKPSNVLLDEDMNPKISDFGPARIIEIDQQQGSTNRIVGTLCGDNIRIKHH